MIRRVIKIDLKKCNGCGLCVQACHEGAIGLVDGKAKLLRDDYCDGLGDCLPVCPTGAISFIERETIQYDEKVVIKNKISKQNETSQCSCPDSKTIFKEKEETGFYQWPVQIKLVSVNAPYFNNANLVIAADCTAYKYDDFHKIFIRNRIVLIGCPKLDSIDYTEKFTHIIKNNNIKSVIIVRMEVPCCSGIENAAKNALQNSGKFIPWQIVIISVDGKILI